MSVNAVTSSFHGQPKCPATGASGCTRRRRCSATPKLDGAGTRTVLGAPRHRGVAAIAVFDPDLIQGVVTHTLWKSQSRPKIGIAAFGDREGALVALSLRLSTKRLIADRYPLEQSNFAKSAGFGRVGRSDA